MTEKIREQIMQIRASGACNMVHAAQVQRLAFEQNFHELVILSRIRDKSTYPEFPVIRKEA
jgi:hypothetical protein